jgi:hypothetical protein
MAKLDVGQYWLTEHCGLTKVPEAARHVIGSDLGTDADSPDLGSSYFYPVPPRKCQNNVSD